MNLQWRDQAMGLALLAIFGAALFDRPRDIAFFTACAYCSCFVLAELGVWLGVVERK